MTMTTLHDERRTPRSGGRTATTPTRPMRSTRDTAPSGAARGPRTEFPTEGSAALRPLEVDAPVEATADAPPRLKVAPPAPVVTPRAPFVLLVLTVVVSGVLGILVLNTKINENAFRLHDLQQRQTALDVQEEQLQQELAELESPGSLAAAARRLGLVPAGTPAFIRLPDGRVLGVPQPASGQPSITSQQNTGAGG